MFETNNLLCTKKRWQNRCDRSLKGSEQVNQTQTKVKALKTKKKVFSVKLEMPNLRASSRMDFKTLLTQA